MVEAAFAARKPLKRKRAKKRVWPRCHRQRCNRIATVEGYCKSHAKQECDRMARQVVLERDKHTCQRCGTTEAVQWAHILTRSELSIRWNPLNSLALCAGCHVYMTHRPVEWMDWVDAHYDENRIDKLRLLRRGILGAPDYAAIIAELRAKVAA